jgi:hypothetical protein
MVTSEGRVFSLSFVSLLPCPLLSIHPLMGFRGSPELVTNVFIMGRRSLILVYPFFSGPSL